MAKSVKETPLFIMESEYTVFTQRHPEYHHFVKVYYDNKSVAGLLAYKSNPNK